jgi:ribosomal protein L20A (L18A)
MEEFNFAMADQEDLDYFRDKLKREIEQNRPKEALDKIYRQIALIEESIKLRNRRIH